MAIERQDELAALFPSLQTPADPPTALSDERYRTHRAVRLLLERLATPIPLVLVLDDVHWADPASIELIAYLVRRPPDAPVLLALAHRPGQAPGPLSAALGAAVRERRHWRVELGPLDRDDARALVGRDLRGEALETLYRESGGNPFYLEELARAARRGPAHRPPRGDTPALGPAPPAVVAALLDELGTLTPDARVVLEAAAVVGEPFEPELAAAAVQVEESDVLESLDELLDAGLIHSTEVPRRFAFRHPLVRRVVYESTKGGWRLAVHARAAAELARQGAAPATRAHHVEQSGQRGDQEAIAVLREAGRAAAARAPATAARWFAAALRLQPERASEGRLELLVPLAAARRGAGRLQESRNALVEALELLPEGMGPARVELVAQCAAVEHWLGRHDEARARLRAALDAVGDRASREAAVLTIELAVDALHRMEFDDLHAYGVEALEVAQGLLEPALVGGAAAMLSVGASVAARADQAQDYRELAAECLDTLNEEELTDRLDALYFLGWSEVFLGRYEDAAAHFGRGIAVSRASGHGRLIVPLLLGKSDACSLPGRLAESNELTDAALDAARLSPNPNDLLWALWYRAWISLLTGDLDTAVAAGAEAHSLATELTPNVFFLGEPGWTYGLALVEAGEVDQGTEFMLAAIGGSDLPKFLPNDRAWACADAVHAELARNRVEAAETWADRAVGIAGELGTDFATAHAQRARAEVLLARGRGDEAAEHALASTAAAERCGSRLDAARSRALAGSALAAAGDRERAVDELRAARRDLAACGAGHWRAQVERELRRLGERIGRAAVAPRAGDELGGVDSLTARELEIADLVTDRRTNREIAATLYLSEKTIESHLRNIFVKLGVSSRVAVARAIEAERQH